MPSESGRGINRKQFLKLAAAAPMISAASSSDAHVSRDRQPNSPDHRDGPAPPRVCALAAVPWYPRRTSTASARVASASRTRFAHIRFALPRGLRWLPDSTPSHSFRGQVSSGPICRCIHLPTGWRNIQRRRWSSSQSREARSTRNWIRRNIALSGTRAGTSERTSRPYFGNLAYVDTCVGGFYKPSHFRRRHGLRETKQP